MTKIGRNTPCPCGSGKKYKRCCEKREMKMRDAKPPAVRTRYEPGSYGDIDAFFPSLLCYRETGLNSWEPYYCLVKHDVCFEDDESSTAMATKHLNAAFDAKQDSGNVVDVAISLRHDGYKKLDEFKIVGDDGVAKKG